MAPSPTPAQAAALLHDLPLNSPIIEIFLNGLYTCLFIFSVASVWLTPEKNPRRKLWTGIMVLLYSCATIHSAFGWQVLALAFQNHGASPDLLNALTHPNLKLKILALVASFLSFLLADMIMVWRCWIVWGRSLVVVIIPILAAVAGTVCASLGLAGQIAVASIQNSTSAIRLAPLVRFSTPFLSLSLGMTLYTTGLIAWRILRVQRYVTKQRTHQFSPDSVLVLEILTESSALYAASLFVFVVLLAMKSPNQNYIQNIHVQIAGIAPTLLIFRISTGRSRPDQEWTSPSSDLRFASSAESAGGETRQDYDSEGYSSAPSSSSVNKVQKAEEEGAGR
ncbi:hypothetical protein MVEN_01588300 [Mycena venus]|uniref:Uncharacterized protein n=1 Tax=Mycena venus TaxID=2733690 RepID=A0A8H7CPT1_9AGAR|nr:hypothetical protein MVEN_01588300 [Mycena venus]